VTDVEIYKNLSLLINYRLMHIDNHPTFINHMGSLDEVVSLSGSIKKHKKRHVLRVAVKEFHQTLS